MQKDFFASAIYFVHAKPTFGGHSPFPAIGYKKRPSGAPNSSAKILGTGKGPLAYRTHPPWHSVQGKALWRTERFRHGAWYRGRPSGAPNSSAKILGTGKGPLAYRTLPPWRLVQEKALWCTERIRKGAWYRKRHSGVPNPTFAGLALWILLPDNALIS